MVDLFQPFQLLLDHARTNAAVYDGRQCMNTCWKGVELRVEIYSRIYAEISSHKFLPQ
jgi:hypothetical protein